MDLIITIALIYFAYRGYQWYTSLQQEVKSGPPPHKRVKRENETIDINHEEVKSDDYLDYEEV